MFCFPFLFISFSFPIYHFTISFYFLSFPLLPSLIVSPLPSRSRLSPRITVLQPQPPASPLPVPSSTAPSPMPWASLPPLSSSPGRCHGGGPSGARRPTMEVARAELALHPPSSRRPCSHVGGLFRTHTGDLHLPCPPSTSPFGHARWGPVPRRSPPATPTTHGPLRV